ncbi:hypothetical protein Tco_0569196 [Tanacetum coccineum]
MILAAQSEACKQEKILAEGFMLDKDERKGVRVLSLWIEFGSIGRKCIATYSKRIELPVHNPAKADRERAVKGKSFTTHWRLYIDIFQ